MKKMFRRMLLVGSISVALCSCGGGVTGGTGVGQNCPAQQGTTCQSLMISGANRTYLLHVPSNFQKNSSALIIVLHGSGGNGLGMEIGTGFSTLADKDGFAVVYPDGLFELNGGQTNWAYFFNEFTDDVGFIRQLINSLQSSVQPDPRKIYVTGLSSGALMSHRLGVQLSDLVAAIGVVEGALFYNAFVSAPPVAPALSPTSVLILHGDQDTTIPCCGTSTVASQDQTLSYWTGTSADNCLTFDTTALLCDSQGGITSVVEKDATNCLGNTEVKYYKLIGGIHTWYTVSMNIPSQVPFNPDFNSATGITTDEVLWNFFAAHPKP
jgi:polyhydroxybutyrate depolymerase